MDGEYNPTDSIVVSTFDCSSLYSKIIGSHGYTGHEIIPGLGIYNANARLYDPMTGRFLSPDPLVQDPASTQNFNRYSYCLNNPLKYTDLDGEFITWRITANSFQIGLNFGGFGFGIETAWNKNGYSIGVYGEVGFRLGGFVDCTVQQSIGYSTEKNMAYSKTTLSAKAGIGILSLSSQATYTDYIGDGQDGVLSVNLSAKATFGVISTGGSVSYKKDFTTSNDSFEIQAGVGLKKNNNQKTNKTELSLNGRMKWKWSDGEWSRKGDLAISYSEAYSPSTHKQSSRGMKENTETKWIKLIERKEYYRKADFSIIEFLEYLYDRNNNGVGYEKTNNNNFGIAL